MAFAHIAICDACGKDAPLADAFPEYGGKGNCPNEQDSWYCVVSDDSDELPEVFTSTSGWVEDTADGREFCSNSCYKANTDSR